MFHRTTFALVMVIIALMMVQSAVARTGRGALGALPAARSSADWPVAAAARLSAPWWGRAPAHLLPAMVGASTDVIMAIAIITAAAADGTASRTTIAAELMARKLSTRGSHAARAPTSKIGRIANTSC